MERATISSADQIKGVTLFSPTRGIRSLGDPSKALRTATLAVMGLGIFLRILSLFFSDNAGGDALARAALTESWVQHPSLQLYFDVWLPLHFWLMAPLALVLKNAVLAGRLLSLLMGVLSILLVSRLARRLYGEEAAFFSTAAFALYSLHIAYSATSSSEATFIFFVLAALDCFFASQASQSRWQLALAGLALSGAAAIRYEGWIILAFISILVLSPWEISKRSYWTSDRLKRVAIFGLTGGFWVVLWLAYSWFRFGHLLYFVSMNKVWVTEQLAFAQTSLFYRIALIPAAIVISLGIWTIAAALLGLLISVRQRISPEFAALVIFFALTQFYQLLSGGVMAFARYSLTMGTFVALLAGLGMQALVSRYALRLRCLHLVFFGLCLFNLSAIFAVATIHNRFSEKFASLSPVLRFRQHMREVGNYLRSRLEPNDAVVIDDYNAESNQISYLVGLPLRPGNRAFLAYSNKVSGTLGYMRQFHPHYVIYADGGELRLQVALPKDCSGTLSALGMRFHCVFSGSIYRVYEVDY